MAASVLDIRGLSYRYPGADRDALHDLAFAVEEGEIFGFSDRMDRGRAPRRSFSPVSSTAMKAVSKFSGEICRSRGATTTTRLA